MADLITIRKTIKDNGITMSSLARSIEMPESTFKTKLSGILEFSNEEMVRLNEALKKIAGSISAITAA